MNEQIRVPSVRLVRDGDQVGVVTIEEAMSIAEEAGLDLVEIAPNADPPVVRVMDYGKFKYEQAKRDREARRGSKQVELREVRMRVKIGKHDRDSKLVRLASSYLAATKSKSPSCFERVRSPTPRWPASYLMALRPRWMTWLTSSGAPPLKVGSCR